MARIRMLKPEEFDPELRQLMNADRMTPLELGMNIAVFVGFGRLSMAWDMVDELPDRFRERGGEPITPWGGDAIIVGERKSKDPQS